MNLLYVKTNALSVIQLYFRDSMVRKRAHQPETINTNTETCSSAQVGGPTFDDYDIMTSSTMSILSEAESDLDTSGGSGKGIYQTRSSPSPGIHDLRNNHHSTLINNPAYTSRPSGLLGSMGSNDISRQISIDSQQQPLIGAGRF